MLLIAAQESVPWKGRGAATALIQFARNIGGAVGVAALGAVLSARLRHSTGGDPRLLEAANAMLDPRRRASVPDALADAVREDKYPFWLGLGIVYEHFHSAKTVRGATTMNLVPEQYVEVSEADGVTKDAAADIAAVEAAIAKLEPGEFSQPVEARGGLHILQLMEHEPSRLQTFGEVADQIGADLTLAPDETTKARVLEATGGIGADVVVESAGKLPVLAQAMDLVRLGGRVLGFGIHTQTEGALPFYDMYFKEIQFINARAATQKDFAACLDMCASGAIDLTPLISDVVPLDQLGQALEMVGTDAPQRMKIILENA